MWKWFWQLDEGRGGNGWSLNNLAWSEIEAWRSLMKVRTLREWEVRAIRAMDNESLIARNTKQEDPDQPRALTNPQDIRQAIRAAGVSAPKTKRKVKEAQP